MAPQQTQKTDVVVMTNGNRITGEVKDLSHGTLDYSTDDMGRLDRVDKVVRLSSSQTFEVTLKSGQKFFGSLVEGARTGPWQSPVPRSTRCRSGRWSDCQSPEVLAPVQRQRRSGTHLRQSEWQRAAQLGRRVRYRGLRRYPTPVQHLSADQTGSDQVTEHNVSIRAQRDLSRGGAPVCGPVAAERRAEPGPSHHPGSGGHAHLVENNREEVRIPVGLVVNQEKFYSSDSSLTSLEAVLGIDVAAFRFDSPKLDFSGPANVFPSLTEAGRVRAQVEFRVKYELFHDFFLGVRLSDSYDSDPPESGAAKNDVTTALAIGWSFNE
jgi:hypothetical protein